MVTLSRAIPVFSILALILVPPGVTEGQESLTLRECC